jgi:hypothetical protein
MRFSALLLLLATLVFALPAGADVVGAGGPVPGSPLQLQIVHREFETFTVDVTNPTDAPVSFNAVGLYFVPTDTAQNEPQRLAVVTNNNTQLGPHQSQRITLEAFCIDNNRGAPLPTTGYHLAGRLPTALTTMLAQAADTIERLGYDPKVATHAPQRSRSDVTAAEIRVATQTAVWRVRAANPVRLVGER